MGVPNLTSTFMPRKKKFRATTSPWMPCLRKKKHYFRYRRDLQRMMLRLLRYDLQVEHEPGKKLLIADTLSRAPKKKH